MLVYMRGPFVAICAERHIWVCQERSNSLEQYMVIFVCGVSFEAFYLCRMTDPRPSSAPFSYLIAPQHQDRPRGSVGVLHPGSRPDIWQDRKGSASKAAQGLCACHGPQPGSSDAHIRRQRDDELPWSFRPPGLRLLGIRGRRASAAMTLRTRHLRSWIPHTAVLLLLFLLLLRRVATATPISVRLFVPRRHSRRMRQVDGLATSTCIRVRLLSNCASFSSRFLPDSLVPCVLPRRTASCIPLLPLQALQVPSPMLIHARWIWTHRQPADITRRPVNPLPTGLRCSRSAWRRLRRRGRFLVRVHARWAIAPRRRWRKRRRRRKFFILHCLVRSTRRRWHWRSPGWHHRFRLRCHARGRRRRSIPFFFFFFFCSDRLVVVTVRSHWPQQQYLTNGHTG